MILYVYSFKLHLSLNNTNSWNKSYITKYNPIIIKKTEGLDFQYNTSEFHIIFSKTKNKNLVINEIILEN